MFAAQGVTEGAVRRHEIKRLFIWGTVALFVIPLVSCGPKLPSDFKTDKEVFLYGKKLFDRGDYTQASKFFEEIQQKYPTSPYMAEAVYCDAVCIFKSGKYPEAVEGFERFIKLYPGHRLEEEARFLLGEAHREQIPSTIDRDQTETSKALEAFNAYIRKYPSGRRAKEVKRKIADLRRQLAERELYVAKFYLHMGKVDSAIGRLKYLIKNYSDVDMKGDDLYYLGLAYYKKGELDMARKALKKLISGGEKRRVSDAKKLLARINK